MIHDLATTNFKIRRQIIASVETLVWTSAAQQVMYMPWIPGHVFDPKFRVPGIAKFQRPGFGQILRGDLVKLCKKTRPVARPVRRVFLLWQCPAGLRLELVR